MRDTWRCTHSHSVGMSKGPIMFRPKSSCIVRVATSAVVCAALALGTAGVALAGQGSHSRDHSSFNSHDHGQHGNYARGVVTLLGSNQITIMDDGTSTLYNTMG